MRLENIVELPSKEWQDKYCYPWNQPKDKYKTHSCNLICDCGKYIYLSFDIEDEYISCICGKEYKLSNI